MVADHDNWIPASEISAKLVQQGVVGKYFSCNVVPTDSVETGSPILFVEGALSKEMKKSFEAENKRLLNDVIEGTAVSYGELLAGYEHRVYWANDLTKIVKLTVSSNI